MMIEPPDAAALHFFERLRQRRLSTTRCRICGTLAFPPRVWCPVCLAEELDWVDLAGRGTVVAFSTQERGLRFNAPDVLGLVNLDEGVRLLSRLAAPLEDLRIGMVVTVDFLEVAPGEVLHQFSPVQAPR